MSEEMGIPGRRKQRRHCSLLTLLLVGGLLLARREISAADKKAGKSSLKEIAAAKGIPYPPPQGKILIDKAGHTLIFYAGEVVLKEYPVALGSHPSGAKLYEGDGHTPEGNYQLIEKIKKERGPHRLSLQIDYPNQADWKRYREALKGGKIPRDSKGKYRPIGGDISIYGGGVGRDWTGGSVAMRDADLEELFEAAFPGIPVLILSQRSPGLKEATPPHPPSPPPPPKEKADEHLPPSGTRSPQASNPSEVSSAQAAPGDPRASLGKPVEDTRPLLTPSKGKTSGSQSLSEPPFPDTRCSLDLREADVREVLRAFAQEYHLNLLLEEGVSGRLNLQFHNLSIREAFLAILNTNGLGHFYDGKVFRVSRLEALSKRKELEKTLEGLEVQVVPLQHTSAEGLTEVIKGLKSDRPGAQIVADKRTNALLLKDVPDNLLQMRTAIERLDVKKVTEIERFQTKILRLKYLTVGGSKPDQSPLGPGSRRAGGGGSSRSSGSRSTQGRSAGPAFGVTPASAGRGIRDSLEGLLSPNGRIDIDEHNNALIVTDLPENIGRIEAILKELDVPARQILIEARIVEATRDFQKRIGILWTAAFSSQGPGRKATVPIQGGRDRQDDPRGQGEHTINLPTPLGTIGVDPSTGIALGRITNRMALDVELNAMEQTGQGRILSTPRVTTLDNKEALIESGLSIPYQKREELGTITIEFADALISLAVIPHVTPDEHILLNILATKDEADFIRQVQGVPTIITRHASTKVLVKDGETTVIGGLTKKDSSTNAARIPWLGKLPLVGWLFRDQQQTDSSEELLIFITPKIVEGAESTRVWEHRPSERLLALLTDPS